MVEQVQAVGVVTEVLIVSFAIKRVCLGDSAMHAAQKARFLIEAKRSRVRLFCTLYCCVVRQRVWCVRHGDGTDSMSRCKL